MRTRTILLCVFGVGVCAVAGCKVGQVTQIGPQSYFNYPNSNVTPLGPVKARVPGPGGLMLQTATGELDAKVYREALAKVPEANLLIDYVKTTHMYMAPLWLVNVYWSEIEIEGTAAKMEVGKQVLR